MSHAYIEWVDVRYDEDTTRRPVLRSGLLWWRTLCYAPLWSSLDSKSTSKVLTLRYLEKSLLSSFTFVMLNTQWPLVQHFANKALNRNMWRGPWEQNIWYLRSWFTPLLLTWVCYFSIVFFDSRLWCRGCAYKVGKSCDRYSSKEDRDREGQKQCIIKVLNLIGALWLTSRYLCNFLV